MTTTQGESKQGGHREHQGGRLEGAVCANVLAALGQPAGPHRVQGRHVGGGRYRVNVFVGEHAAAFRIAHSFFVEADGNGNVVESTPPITRAY